MTEVQEQAVETDAAGGFSFTMPAADFTAALKAVALFSCTDDTLPSICGVQIELKGAQLVLRATDRYSLAVQAVELDPASVQGAGELVLTKAIVKTLAAVKVGYGKPLITLTVPAEGGLHVAFPDASNASYPAREFDNVGQFPRLQMLFDRWEMIENAPVSVSYNPALLARFTKIAKEVELSPGKNSMVKFTCGDVVGLIVHLRKQEAPPKPEADAKAEPEAQEAAQS